MRSSDQLNELVKQAAWKVFQALSVFDDERPEVQAQLHNGVFSHVQALMRGEKLNIEGQGLIVEIPEPGQAEPINTGVTNPDGEGPEAL